MGAIYGVLLLSESYTSTTHPLISAPLNLQETHSSGGVRVIYRVPLLSESYISTATTHPLLSAHLHLQETHSSGGVRVISGVPLLSESYTSRRLTL